MQAKVETLLILSAGAPGKTSSLKLLETQQDS